MWSNKQFFSKSQELDTISTRDVEFALSSLLKIDTNEDSKLADSFSGNTETPEVVVLFVEPQLATDQVPHIASAFAGAPGGSFQHLKKSLDTADFSLVVPYAKVDELTLFDDALANVFDSIKLGTIFISRMPDSNLFTRLERQNGVVAVGIDSLLTSLKSAHAFTNGVTDLVVVCFDYGRTHNFASHDAILGSISDGIRIATKGNYVALYSANIPAPSNMKWTFEQHSFSE
jgi:hypothetical protein